MIAVVPVRYTATDSVWSREQFENWMRPGIDHGLGDFWWRSTRGLFDVSSQVYDPVEIPNPVPVSDDAKRASLHEAVVKAATQVDWAHTDVLLIWLAKPTGWWGGGEVDVPVPGGTKRIRVTVVDSITPFDAACQELGHGYGLQHEFDALGREYASPYSAMSARGYGPTAPGPQSWVRGSTPKLPEGGPNMQGPYVGVPANRIVGPLVPGAHLYRDPRFRDSSSVVHVRDLPAKARLYKPDYRSPGSGKPVLIAVPSQRRDGRTFLVELRRATTGTYDQAIGVEGLVVHSLNPDGLVRYDGVADLSLTDWACSAGDFSLRRTTVGEDFVDVEVRAGSVVSFPIRGVLLAGGFRTQRQLNTMSREDMRNTLIVVMASLSKQSDYQRYDNDILAGMGAVMVFLRRNGLRDDAALKTMTADDQRNVMIVELGAQTGAGQALQGFTNLQLAQIALGSDLATRGRRPGSTPFYGRGVLLAGRFRSQHQLNTMSRDDMRNTLIVVMASLSNQKDYQAYSDPELAGVGAVMVFLRETGIRDDAALRKMSADDQRNVAIVELAAQTGRNLQGLSNLDLALTALGVERF
ncbi:hypothetical protein SAMN04488564_1206 [Lentzea waywayandensis]|uniref:Uncharacterized protein n=1 Tax=Lentzea waywayandensis TaxID=84724 RepID=A0A1I6FHV9_9PSEU|nr:hypothetical protein [Lentzea waywayandensis]SFR29533.1 hypothetical protein SAMN04488564_1206 [Lentzea waywayandensis]